MRGKLCRDFSLDSVAPGFDAFCISANAQPKRPGRRLSLWPMAAILLGALAAVNPFYHPHIPPRIGYAAWLADLALAIVCLMCPPLARAGVMGCGLFLAAPCLLHARPLLRAFLMCLSFLPLLVAALPLLKPSITDARSRLYFLMSWLGTRELKRRPRSFQAAALLQFAAAALVFAVMIASVRAVPASGLWFAPRWLAGGSMVFAFAEMATAFHNFLTGLMGLAAPGLMNSPVLATSIGGFWTERWNPAASVFFRKSCYEPLARHGKVQALFAAFFVSGVVHLLLAYMALGRWGIAVACGTFFVVQPLLILIERRMNVRRWRPATARVWTLAALAVACPLFIEPTLQVIAPNLQAGGPASLTAAMVVFVALMTGFFAAFSLLAVRVETVKK